MRIQRVKKTLFKIMYVPCIFVQALMIVMYCVCADVYETMTDDE